MRNTKPIAGAGLLLFLIGIVLSVHVIGVANGFIERHQELTSSFGVTEGEWSSGIVAPVSRSRISVAVDGLSGGKPVINNPAVIPFGDFQHMYGWANSSTPNLNADGTPRTFTNGYRLQRAYAWIFKSLQRTRTSFIVYPYQFRFDDTFENDKIVRQYGDRTLEKGAIVRATNNGMPWKGYFNYMNKEDRSVTIEEGQALYDGHVAVLKVNEALTSNGTRDLTYESTYYCTAMRIYLGKFTECFNTESYEQYINEAEHPEDSSFVYVNETNVQDGWLSDTHYGNEVQILIIPDTIMRMEQTIVERLGASGKAAIAEFVANGGTVIVSGKGALVAEKLGLIPSGSVDPTKLISATRNEAYMTGCEGANVYPDRSLHHATACMGIMTNKDGTMPQYLLSSYLLKKTDDLEVLASFDHTLGALRTKDPNTGFTTAAKQDYAMLARHVPTNAKGQVFVNLAHPVGRFDAMYPLFLNTVMMGLTRNVMYTQTIEHAGLATRVGKDVLPALEPDLFFEVNSAVLNLHAEPITNVEVTVQFAQYFAATINDPACVPINEADIVPAPGFIEGDKYYKWSTGYKCTIATIPGQREYTLPFNVLIEDALATRRKWNIFVSGARLKYTKSNGENVELDVGASIIQAKSAALIRADYNIDPSSFYPLPSRGYTIDPVVTANNRENSAAYDVQHVQIIPLATPLVDGSDQLVVADILDFWDTYYKKNPTLGTGNGRADYKYPFDDGARSNHYGDVNADHMDLALLAGRGVIITAEWDDPIKMTKAGRGDSDYSPAFPQIDMLSTSINSIFQAQLEIDIASINEVVNQVAYPDYATRFEIAQQRYVPYLDTTYNVSATTLWGSNTNLWPASTLKAGEAGSRPLFNSRRFAEEGVITARRNIGLTRTDLYFMTGQYYETKGRQYLPKGQDTPFAFYTIDKHTSLASSPPIPFNQASLEGVTPDGEVWRKGEWTSETEHGIIVDENYNGLHQTSVPDTEFGTQRREMIHYDSLPSPTGPIEESNTVTKTHYLLPLVMEDVRDERDVRFFDGVTHSDFTRREGGFYIDTDGHEYDMVRVINAFQGEITLPAPCTRRGGEFTFTLPAGVGWGDKTVDEILNNDLITFGVDHLAVIDITPIPPAEAGGRWVIKAKFRRGNMPNERYAQYGSPVQIALEGLKTLDGQYMSRLTEYSNHTGAYTHPDITLAVSVKQLKYDLTSAVIDKYIPVSEEELGFNSVVCGNKPFLSLPGVKLTFNFERCTSSADGECPADSWDSVVRSYEQVEQFSRYRLYYQELNQHSTVWGSVETHYKHPGRVSKSAGFGAVSTIGTSSIPLREYLTTGKSQVIPLASTTGRITWEDLWGRKMAQPLRSAFADIPPIPPPLRNFMMSTTFEVLDSETGKRYTHAWPTDRPVDVKVLAKFTNNYPKYFDHTECGQNERDFWPTLAGRHKVYDGIDDIWTQAAYQTDGETANSWLKQAYWSKYGACWSQPGTVLEGTLLGAAVLEQVNATTLCPQDLNVTECAAQVPLPSVHLRICPGDDKTGAAYQYSPAVEDWYPEGYVTGNMWDMTHYDYAATAYAMGYPYHMDNQLPNVDNGIYRPHNIVVWPVWKGLGFAVDYNKDRTNPKYPVTEPAFSHMTGWWSDNLQNKDDTLLAGQATVNEISVGKDSLIPEDKWVDAFDLVDETGALPDKVANRLKNYYVCHFGRKRPVVGDDNYHETKNVQYNNVVPIDYRPPSGAYNAYDCTADKTFYTPDTIQNFTRNYIETNYARDWMYFGVNLRGGAHETLGSYLHMEPLEDVSVEGDVKVFDGARYQYWNPANGPNSFIIVDDETNVVEGKRSDIAVTDEAIPAVVATTNTRFYQIINLRDAGEMWRNINGRPFTMQVSAIQYGYGDLITVGYSGENGTKCVLEPTEGFTHRVTIKNNVGWDIHILNGGMTIDEACIAPEARVPHSQLMADNVQCRYLTNVTAYSFMTPHVPEELAPYITIKPSTMVKDMQPLFFDFEHVNMPTIRDGFKGTYYYEVIISPDFPQSLRGRVHRIPITLDASKLQGGRDLSQNLLTDKIAEYGDEFIHLPPIMFGVPFNATGDGIEDPDAAAQVAAVYGKVFDTLGHSTDVRTTFQMPESVKLVDAKIMSEAQVKQFRKIATTDYKAADESLEARYLDTAGPMLTSTTPATKTGGWATYEYEMASAFDSTGIYGGNIATFPANRLGLAADGVGLADLADMYMVVRCHRPTSPWGAIPVMRDLTVTYKDWEGREKVATEDLGVDRTVEAKGAFLDSTFESLLVDPITNQPLLDQRLVWAAKNKIRVTTRLTNYGDIQAYDARGSFIVSEDFTIDVETTEFEVIKNAMEDGRTNMTIKSNTDIPPGDAVVLAFYLTNDGSAKNVTTDASTDAVGADDGRLTWTDKVTTVDNPKAEYRIDSNGELITQPLTLDAGHLTFTFGGVTIHDVVSLGANLISHGVVRLTAVGESPDIQYLFQRRIDKTVWEDVARGYDSSIDVDMGDLTAFVEFRVMTVRVYDENIGPQMVAASPNQPIFLEGASPVFKRVLLYCVYFGTFFVGLIFAFVKEGTVSFWQAIETKPESSPVYVPEDITDKCDMAVAKHFNDKFRETGEYYSVRRLGTQPNAYEIGGQQVRLKLKRNKPVVKDEGKVVGLETWIQRFELPPVSELPPHLRAILHTDTVQDASQSEEQRAELLTPSQV